MMATKQVMAALTVLLIVLGVSCASADLLPPPLHHTARTLFQAAPTMEMPPGMEMAPPAPERPPTPPPKAPAPKPETPAPKPMAAAPKPEAPMPKPTPPPPRPMPKAPAMEMGAPKPEAMPMPAAGMTAAPKPEAPMPKPTPPPPRPMPKAPAMEMAPGPEMEMGAPKPEGMPMPAAGVAPKPPPPRPRPPMPMAPSMEMAPGPEMEMGAPKPEGMPMPAAGMTAPKPPPPRPRRPMPMPMPMATPAPELEDMMPAMEVVAPGGQAMAPVEEAPEAEDALVTDAFIAALQKNGKFKIFVGPSVKSSVSAPEQERRDKQLEELIPAAEREVCDDRPPPNVGDFSCEMQKAFGKCYSRFMLRHNYCARTCGRKPCPALKPELQLSMPNARRAWRCTDVPPNALYTCEQQMMFGQCDEPFMVNGGFCANTCGRKPCPARKQPTKPEATSG